MSNELLEVTINGDLSVADNVEAVCAATMERAKAALKEAGIEIVDVEGTKVAKGVTDSKDHKTLCTNLNKTAKFLSDQRIDFEKRLYEVPAVKRIVEAMKKTADEVLAMREPIWGKYNQIVDASKPPEEHFKVFVCFKDITMSELEKMKKKWAKDGIVTEVGAINKMKREEDK